MSFHEQEFQILCESLWSREFKPSGSSFLGNTVRDVFSGTIFPKLSYWAASYITCCISGQNREKPSAQARSPRIQFVPSCENDTDISDVSDGLPHKFLSARVTVLRSPHKIPTKSCGELRFTRATGKTKSPRQDSQVLKHGEKFIGQQWATKGES